MVLNSGSQTAATRRRVPDRAWSPRRVGERAGELAEAAARVTGGAQVGRGAAAAHGELACEPGDDEAGVALEQQGAADDDPPQISPDPGEGDRAGSDRGTGRRGRALVAVILAKELDRGAEAAGGRLLFSSGLLGSGSSLVKIRPRMKMRRLQRRGEGAKQPGTTGRPSLP